MMVYATRLKRRNLLRMVGLGVLGTTLSACTTPVVKETVVVEKVVTATVAPKAPVELLCYQRNIPQDVVWFKELAESFHEIHPDITVRIEITPDDYNATLQARIASGTAGDLGRNATSWGMTDFALRGLYYALDDYVERDAYDVNVHLASGLYGATADGKLYALPVYGHPGWSCIYYMPELFAEAGIGEPTYDWTYDDMTQAAIALTKDLDGDGKTDQYGIWLAPYWEATLTPMEAFGAWPMNEEGTTALYDDPKAIDAVRWIRDMMQSHKVALPNPSFDSRVELWSSGKVGMVLSGIWENVYLGDYTPEGKTMKLAPGPRGPSGRRGGYAGFNVWPIWRSSKYPDQAWEWMKYLCTKETGIEAFKRVGEPGCRHDVWEDPELTENPLCKPHGELMKTVRHMPIPANGRLREIANPMGQLLSAIWLDELTPEEGCARMQVELQQILDQPRPGL